MATGGGKNPPTFSLPLPPRPPSSSSSSPSRTDSLQTPDTSTLFVHTLSSEGHSSNSIAPSSFTSLEELLNITGINSFPPTPPTPSQGTHTLQLLAKDADSKQITALPPHTHPALEDGHLPLKKPRLQDAPTNSFLPPKAPASSLPTNIRVQSLTSDKLAMSDTGSNSKLNAHSHTISLFPAKNSALGSGSLGRGTADTTAGTFDLTQHNTSRLLNHSFLQQGKTAPPTVPSGFRSPQLVNPSSGVAAVLPRSHLTGSVPRDPATSVRASSPSMTTFTSLAQSPKSSLAQPHATFPVSSSAQKPNALSMPHRTGVGTTTHLSPLTPPTGHTPPITLPAPAQLTAARPNPSASMNPKGLALQLVQQYKLYQLAGDQQGVARVKQQLSILLKAGQMAAGQRTPQGAPAPQGSPGPQGAPANVGTAVNHSMAAATTTAVAANHSLPPAAPRNVTSVASTAATDLLSTPQLSSMTVPRAGQGASPSINQPIMRASQQSSAVPASVVGLPTRQGTPAPAISRQGTPAPAISRQGTPAPAISRQDPPLGSPPPSLLAHIPSTRNTPLSAASSNGPTPLPQHAVATTTLLPTSQAQARAEALKAALATYRIRQLHVLMQSLPAEQRPKSMEDLKEFMRKYNEKLQPTPPSPLGAAKPLDGSTKTTSSLATATPTYNSIQSPPSHLLTKSPAVGTQPGISASNLVGGASSNVPPVGPAVGAVGVTTLQPPGSHPAPSSFSDTVGDAMAAVLPHQSLLPPAPPTQASPASQITSTHLHLAAQQATPSLKGVATQSLAPPTHSTNQASSQVATPTSSQLAGHGSSIQPGVPTPLPPGVNLETLVGLCRLPEAQLLKLQLPQPLLSAISIWKMRQSGSPSLTSSSSGALPSRDIADDIPVIIPPQLPAPGHAPGGNQAANSAGFVPPSSAQSTAGVRTTSGLSLVQNRPGSMSQASLPPLPSFLTSSLPPSAGQALRGTAGIGSLQATIPLPSHSRQEAGLKAGPQTSRGNSVASLPGVGTAQLQGSAVFGSGVSQSSASGVTLARPLIPPSQGFPPRSLHSYIPSLSGGGAQGLGGVSAGLQRTQLPGYSLDSHLTKKPPPYSVATARSTTLPVRISAPLARPQTRYQTRVEQEKAEHERVQAISKALQSSEEVRIAFRFGAHLDKMHQQLLQPDTLTPFRSQHDILARLLPYHVWAEPDPPPEGTQKADGLLESVARVLLSRSHGLLSRYQQLVAKDAALEREAGMQACLDRLFIETEHEREEQERLEKQQAEQIAADLSLIAGENRVTFDTDFSLSDIMNSDPLLGLDPGIT